MDIRVFNALKPYVGPFLGPAVTTPTYTGTITTLTPLDSSDKTSHNPYIHGDYNAKYAVYNCIFFQSQPLHTRGL